MSVEPESPTWRAVKAFAESEIEKARDALELPGPADVSNLRGRIKALREVLGLATAAPAITASAELY